MRIITDFPIDGWSYKNAPLSIQFNYKIKIPQIKSKFLGKKYKEEVKMITNRVCNIAYMGLTRSTIDVVQMRKCPQLYQSENI